MVLKDEEVSSDEESDGSDTTEGQEDKSVTPYIYEDDENYSTTAEDKRGNEDTDYKVSFAGEFVANGFNDNILRFEKGTVGLFRNNYSMNNLNQESYNSGSSLFFITTKEESTLNGEYAAFGKVIEGMDLIEKMLTLPVEDEQTDENGNTTSDSVAGTMEDGQEIKKYAVGSFPVITKATVETFGINYEMPIYMKAFDYDKYMSDLLLQYYSNQ